MDYIKLGLVGNITVPINRFTFSGRLKKFLPIKVGKLVADVVITVLR